MYTVTPICMHMYTVKPICMHMYTVTPRSPKQNTCVSTLASYQLTNHQSKQCVYTTTPRHKNARAHNHVCTRARPRASPRDGRPGTKGGRSGAANISADPRPQELGLFSRHLGAAAAADGGGGGAAQALTAAQRSELREVFELLCRAPSAGAAGGAGGAGGRQGAGRLALRPLLQAAAVTGDGLAEDEVRLLAPAPPFAPSLRTPLASLLSRRASLLSPTGPAPSPPGANYEGAALLSLEFERRRASLRARPPPADS